MPTVGFGRMSADTSLEELVQIVAKMQKTLDYLMQGGLDSKNAREFGGWVVGQTELVSKDDDVGMSTEDTVANDVRFWAGGPKDTAPFRVYEDGDISAESGTITGATIQNQTAAGNKVYIDSTGFHANDAAGIERITIGTTPAKGAKALVTRNAAGTAQGVYTYDTENVDGASRTGQYITAHGAYILIGNDGSVRIQNSSGAGIKIDGSGKPQIKDAFGAWVSL